MDHAQIDVRAHRVVSYSHLHGYDLLDLVCIRMGMSVVLMNRVHCIDALFMGRAIVVRSSWVVI